MGKQLSDWVENIVEKGEIARYWGIKANFFFFFFFLKENRIQNNVEKRELAFNEHEQFLLSHYVCWVFIRSI